ncbi:MAG: ABC transporter substrate-binding protein [Pseudomonadales bacterium]|nr:ABC transporter substrate-binding protein [Pseudomonadales bacterium]
MSILIIDVRSRLGLCLNSVALGLMLLATTANALAVAEIQKTPYETVELASDQLLALIKQTIAQEPTDEEIFYSAVTEVLDPFIDFNAIARSVMAVHYKRATDEHRAAFTASFKTGLVRTYSKALLKFGSGGVKVLAPTTAPRNPKRPTVKMEIRSDAGKIYPVSYSMGLSDDGNWKMRNVIVNGLNIGLTFRSQFSASMKQHRNDLDAVIAGWSALVESESARSIEE